MLEEEVLVAPGLEARVLVVAEGHERVSQGAVEVRGVFLEAVVGREVHAAAEPHDRLSTARQRGEHAHVHVHRRHVRVRRVEDERDAHRLERRLGEVGGAVLGRRRGQRVTLDVREVAATALEQPAAFDQPRESLAFELAARFALPGVGGEGLAAFGLQRRDDARLQAQEVVADVGGGHRVVARHQRLSPRWPMSRRHCAPSKAMPRSAS